MMDISEADCADILEASEIETRIAFGGLTTTIGSHPELGAFSVTQTMGELGRQFILATSADEDVVIEVLDDWGGISGVVPMSVRLDRLDAKSEG